jgi:RNA polymerase I-specific transcription initiation factor RRN7
MVQIVCRDLWALHLSLMRNPPPAEPYLAAHESDVEAPNPTASTPEKEAGSSPEVLKTSSSDEESDEAENDPELDELLAENSASESSEGEDEVDTKSMPPAAKSKHTGGRHQYERPANTLAVIVLACWTLRVPILYRDLTRQVALASRPCPQRS